MTTTTSTTTSTTTTTSTSTTTITYPVGGSIGFVEGWFSTSSSSTTTTTVPSYVYEWGVPRKTGLTVPTSEKITIVLPTAAATDMDPFSLKTYVPLQGRVGIFDGAGANRLDTGTNVYDFTVIAPQNKPSVSSTTSTT